MPFLNQLKFSLKEKINKKELKKIITSKIDF
jgi:hypothetical protein